MTKIRRASRGPVGHGLKAEARRVSLQTQHRELADEAELLRQRCDELEQKFGQLGADRGEDRRGGSG